MHTRELNSTQGHVLELARLQRFQELMPLLRKMPAVEVADLLDRLGNDEVIAVLGEFAPQQQGLILADLPLERQLDLLRMMSQRRAATAFNALPSEHRADLYQHLSQQEQAALLPFLTKEVREDVIRLSAYPPETAGGIMSTDFATVQEDMHIAEAMNKVRRDAPSKRTIYYVYVVDADQRLKGFITLKDLVLAQPHRLVKEEVHRDFVFAHVTDDREEVARKIEKYDLVALPILNDREQLVGIVTHDEALDVIRSEHTEDLEKFMGIVPAHTELGYLETSSVAHFRKRVMWVVSLAAVGIISGVIIHRFENALEQLIILALYMPMVADTGGNAGSQAATVVVRALALGQITVGNWLRVLWKEARVSLLMALCLGLLAYGKVLFLSWETEVPLPYSLAKVAFVISLALSLQVVASTVIGAGLPLLVKRFGGDPAVAASPAITTVVDITGLLIYFSTATFFLFS
jgi:magnesium transporter